MSNKLHQQNGKNWREYRLEEDRLIITTVIQGAENKSTLPLDVGLISPNFDELFITERVAGGKIVGLLVVISLMVMFASFPMLGSKNSAFTGIGLVVGILSLVGLFMALSKSQPQKVAALRIYMGNSYFFCYGRDEKDRDQVKDFIHTVLEAQRNYFRHKYLTPNPAMSQERIRDQLSWLYENKLITDKELTEALRKFSPPSGKGID